MAVLAVLLLVAVVMWHAFIQVQKQIIEANQLVANNNVRIALLEAWVRAQVAYVEQGLTTEEVQAVNAMFSPTLDHSSENASAEKEAQ